MTVVDLAAVRARHRAVAGAGAQVCGSCETVWPCDAAQLADELDQQRIVTAAARDLVVEWYDEQQTRGTVSVVNGATMPNLRDAIEALT